MTDKDYTHIYVLLDRSGSMQVIRPDTEGGFDAFIAKQREVPGRCKVTLAQFDDRYEVVYHLRNVHDVPPLNLQPRNSTALHDSLARLINDAGRELAAMPEQTRPASVIVLVLTDGMENASREWNGPQVRELIERQRNQYNWVFVYLGANQDAVTVGRELGFARGQSMTYAGRNVAQTMSTTADNINAYRVGTQSGLAHEQSVALADYTEVQRDEAVAEDER